MWHVLLQAKIVEALLGFEVIQVSCGASHVLAVTNDYEVFSWGRGDNGRKRCQKLMILYLINSIIFSRNSAIAPHYVSSTKKYNTK